jgi:Ca2+:H+ antiporter
VPVKKLWRELYMIVLWASAILFLIFGHGWTAQARGAFALALFAWLFLLILWSAFGVVRHAEEIAERLGEPFGTLVLTLSVTVIEVTFIVTAMTGGAGGSTLARDAVFAVVMITLNGVAGLSLLAGALRHREQSISLPGNQAFLAVLIPLASFALILPNFTTSTPGPTLSSTQATVIGALTLALYGIFLSMQTVRHRGFFAEPGEETRRTSPHDEPHEDKGRGRAIAFHAAALLLTLVPVVYLAEELSQIARFGIEAIGAPRPVAGVLIAVLVLAPESMGAFRAALADRPQRAVNITLGSALATIGLTIPAVLAVSVATGTPVALGLAAEEMVLLAVTFAVSMITFAGERTNVLLGAVHAVMFLVFVLLLFDP